MALKRLMQEYKELSRSNTPGIVAGPSSDDNILVWDAAILGPTDTYYDGGCFRAELVFPADYPLNPPTMRFVSNIWHPNVYPDGRVCISILHPPGNDEFGYEKSCERWSPVQSIEKILLSVVSMLAEPNDESPANVDAAKMWRTDKEAFRRTTDRCVRASVGLL